MVRSKLFWKVYYMDVKLQNAYVEVLLGNFMEVVKQNLMFQAQLEVGKQVNIDADGVRRKIQELTGTNEVVIPTTLVQELRTLQESNKNISDDDLSKLWAKIMLSSKLTGWRVDVS